MCWVERKGGNKGGSWGSWPVELEDEGEVIGGSFAAAIKLPPAALRIALQKEEERDEKSEWKSLKSLAQSMKLSGWDRDNLIDQELNQPVESWEWFRSLRCFEA